MKFIKLIETRFADPVTAIDLSKTYVCHGSAMGRIAFHNIKEGKDLVLSDSQPELVRGISHSKIGNYIYISIGDVSCQKLNADDLRVVDNVIIVDITEEKSHKPNCERAFTLLYQHQNCVINMNLIQKKPEEPKPIDDNQAPISLSNLETNKLEQFGKDEFEFTQNTVPFDFDGENLLWMVYLPKGVRELNIFDFATKKYETILTFTAGEGIISHCKLSGQKSSLNIIYVKDCQKIIMYNIKNKTAK